MFPDPMGFRVSESCYARIALARVRGLRGVQEGKAVRGRVGVDGVDGSRRADV